MDNPEILATYGTQNKDEEKQNKNTTQYVFDTNMRQFFAKYTGNFIFKDTTIIFCLICRQITLIH
jgi:predicted DNA binding CopG/RHH family protein